MNRHMWSGLESVRIRGFRSLGDADFYPGSLSALVGESGAGKSNLLAAVRSLLDPNVTPAPADSQLGVAGVIRVQGQLAGGGSLSVEADPSSGQVRREGLGVPVLFLPARLRDGRIVDEPVSETGPAQEAEGFLRLGLAELTHPQSDARGKADAASSLALVNGIESCCAADLAGLVLLIEEPELYLRPHAQRYLYRLLHRFAGTGNQVMYSTHSPAFLNVARLEELTLLERTSDGMTRVVQPEPLPADDELRALGEFDAERSELFLSQTAILVEGRTEKLVLPFVFEALGYDMDREAISVVDCRGKSNIPLFARVCQAVGIPSVAVHDRDALRGQEPSLAEKLLNDRIRATVGQELTIELVPDFEGVAGLHGQAHKPARAWQHFKTLSPSNVSQPLAHIVELALSVAASR
jgi:hypothetical protein